MVGCAQDNVGTAVQYLEAINDREVQDVSDFVCAERADDITAALMTVADDEEAEFSFINVSCAAQGGDVECRYSIRQETDEANVYEEYDRAVTFEFEDGQICGFEQEVAN